MILSQNKQGLVKLQTNEFLDPEFLKLESLSVQEAVYCPPDIVVEKLAHRITRMPNDLRSHVQRIFIFMTRSDAGQIFSALVDLFLALGNNGQALRKRMLHLSKPYLLEEQYLALQSSLAKEMLDEITLPKSAQPLLRKGRKNNKEFIFKMVQDGYAELTIMEQVHSYIEFGQIEQAKTLLQQSIIETPGDGSLLEKLLEIFQKSADKADFLSFYQQMQQHHIDIPDAWHKQEIEFKQEQSTLND